MEGNRRLMPLDIIVVSAKDLKEVNLFTKMDVYAVASINGDHRTKQRTPVDKGCGSNPNWNSRMMFTVDRDAVCYLLIQLKSHRMLGDRDIGTVQVPIKELFNRNEEAEAEQHVSYNVRLPNGEEKGILNFSYKFGEMFNGPVPGRDEPAMAYPPPAIGYPGPNSAHPTPPAAYTPPVTGYPGPNPGYPSPPGEYPSPVTGYLGPNPGHPTPPAAYPPPVTGYPGPNPGYPTPPGAYPPSGTGYPGPNSGHPAPSAAYPPPVTGYPGPTQGYPTPSVQTPQKPQGGFVQKLHGAMLLGELIEDVYDQAGFEGGLDFGLFL